MQYVAHVLDIRHVNLKIFFVSAQQATRPLLNSSCFIFLPVNEAAKCLIVVNNSYVDIFGVLVFVKNIDSLDLSVQILHAIRDFPIECLLSVRTNILKRIVADILQKGIVCHAETLSQIVFFHVQHLVDCIKRLCLRFIRSIHELSVVSKFVRKIQQRFICEEGAPLKANQRSP